MLSKIKEIWGKADDIIFTYPMVLIMALIAAISAVVGFSLDGQANQFLVTKFCFSACLGISLMFSAKMLSQRIGKGFLWEILAIGILAVFYFVLPDSEKDFTEVHAFIIVPTFILSHLLVSFIAFLGKSKELNFWQFNKNLFINIVLTAIFTGVLVGGILLAILAVDKLFDFNFSDNLYPKTFFFTAILGSCFIFLLFNDRGLHELEEDNSYPVILKFFTQFILIPLLIIYAVILYFYAAKILIHWELPRGWVSYLILAYSIVGILALLLVHPLKEQSTKSWVKIFSKVFYYTLVPLIILLFVAIFTRILEYGYTEARYFVLLIALWLTSVVLYFILFRKATIKFIPISLFVFGFFALIFPYFNAFSVSERSQKREFVKILNENNLLKNSKIDFQHSVSNNVVDEISNKVNYLFKRDDEQFVYSFLEENYQRKLSSKYKYNKNVFASINEFFTNVKVKNTENNRTEIYDNQPFIAVKDYQYIIPISQVAQDFQIGKDELKISNSIYGQTPKLIISINKDQVDIYPFIQEKMSQYTPQNNRILVNDISKETKVGSHEIKIVFKNLVKERNNSRESFYFNEAYLLIK